MTLSALDTRAILREAFALWRAKSPSHTKAELARRAGLTAPQVCLALGDGPEPRDATATAMLRGMGARITVTLKL